MAETTKIEFTNNELLRILLKEQNIKEGHWVLAATFKFGAMNMGESPSEASPTAVATISRIAIERVSDPLPFSVNAAEL